VEEIPERGVVEEIFEGGVNERTEGLSS